MIYEAKERQKAIAAAMKEGTGIENENEKRDELATQGPPFLTSSFSGSTISGLDGKGKKDGASGGGMFGRFGLRKKGSTIGGR